MLISKIGTDGCFGTTDVPTLLTAMRVEVDYLITHNRVHFMDDPKVAFKTNLRIGAPGVAPNWVRK